MYSHVPLIIREMRLSPFLRTTPAKFGDDMNGFQAVSRIDMRQEIVAI